MFLECVLQELEDTMNPPIAHGPRPAALAAWKEMFKQMQSELKRGFVREDGTTTSQPVRALCYAADDPDQPCDVRYGAVVGLGFIACSDSLPALRRIDVNDIIWLVRHEARQVARNISLTTLETKGCVGCHENRREASPNVRPLALDLPPAQTLRQGGDLIYMGQKGRPYNHVYRD